ncbi:conserved hypothetical protein [Exiguobacterium sp. 8H]|uniref:helix-turn-helix domain-containing protein n=1 Tax=unclassified Exiguobacterium TaxID=2644629 RepID=UPI0012F27644|nr:MULTISPECIES: helix-turn-helix domain-containing protein [unclassified Exiguobacterium]VXB83705.1 conserved hypothetical protein [Exiguobacterium sp. 8H]VXB99083.1 conserved hypothetical protein [Exiguobacterium sp. 8A]
MIEFVSRTSQIAYTIYMNTEGTTIQALSNKYGVSANTIRKELNQLDAILPEGWQLVREGRTGVQLISPLDSKIEDLLNSLNKSNDMMSLLKLIIEKDECTSEFLCDYFGYSKATLYRKVKHIKDWLFEYDIILETIPYYYFDGDERKIRAMMVQFYDIYFSGNLLTSELTSAFSIPDFKHQLGEILLSNNIFISMEETRRLVLLLHTMHIRAGFLRYIPELNREIRRSGIYYSIANKLHLFFPKYLNNDVMQNEFAYFSLNLFAGGRPKNRQEEIWSIRDNKDNDLRFIWIFSFLEELSQNFYFDFSSDDQLVYDLSNFISRVNTDHMLLTNTRNNQLIHYFPHLNENKLLSIIDKALRLTPIQFPSDKDYSLIYQETDKIQLLVLIRASLERFKQNITINVVIVCNTLLEFSNIHAELVYRYGNRLDIRYIESSHVHQVRLNPYVDFVISTVKTISKYVPHLVVIDVGTIPDNSDYEMISEYVMKFSERKMSGTYTETQEVEK